MVCLIIVCAHHAVIVGVLFFTLRVCSWCKININSSPVFARDAACLQKTRQFLDNYVSISLEKSLNFTENVENIHHSVYSDVDLNY